MVAHTDIGNDRHLAKVKTKTLSQQSASSSLKYRRINVGMD
jgi:hypothetical protein